MGYYRRINTVDTHTAGEPTRVVTSGFPMIRVQSMVEAKLRLQEDFDHLRTALLHEPRGHQDMFGAIVFPPTVPKADFGVVFMDGGGYLNMCGHGSMGVVRALAEIGMLNDTQDEVLLDTPAGVIQASINDDDEGALISIRNIPSYVHGPSIPFPAERLAQVGLETADGGPLTVDVSFGGNFFALVDSQQFDEDLQQPPLDDLVELALTLRDYINVEARPQHPESPDIGGVDLVEFYYKTGVTRDNASNHRILTGRNLVVFGEGQIDRSPCGTGTSAEMALLLKKGLMSVDDDLVQSGVLDTKFRGRIIAETVVAGNPGIIPEISGRAYVTGFNQFVLDDRDPLSNGFSLRSLGG